MSARPDCHDAQPGCLVFIVVVSGSCPSAAAAPPAPWHTPASGTPPRSSSVRRRTTGSRGGQAECTSWLNMNGCMALCLPWCLYALVVLSVPSRKAKRTSYVKVCQDFLTQVTEGGGP